MRVPLLVLLLIAPPCLAQPPDAVKSAAAVAALRDALAADPAVDVAKKDFATVPLTKDDAAAARDLLWKAHVERLKKDRAQEMKDGVLKDGKLELKFTAKTFGKRPEAGHSLWISLHGGGNAAPRVNDQQWENQKKLYTLDEGIYVAPRAPTNTWNLWHEPHIDRMFARLIENYIALEGVDPDHVYVLGYSAGGDGVYQLAPRMADRWCAAGMMAGHPNDASPLPLRNVAFALQVGGMDSAYNRNKVAAEWGKKLVELYTADPNGYEHYVKIHETKGHWMGGEDAAALPWMAKRERKSAPDRVVWKPSAQHDRSYWLGVPADLAKAGGLVSVTRLGQTFTVTEATGLTKLIVRFDDRTANLDQPVKIRQKGKTLYEGSPQRTIAVLAQTLAGRGDPKLMYSAEVTVEPEK